MVKIKRSDYDDAVRIYTEALKELPFEESIEMPVSPFRFLSPLYPYNLTRGRWHDNEFIEVSKLTAKRVQMLNSPHRRTLLMMCLRQKSWIDNVAPHGKSRK